MQYFFVDESGDAGLRNPKNSPYYIVAMVQLPNHEPIAELNILRQNLNLPLDFEFHYYKLKTKQKESFFHIIEPFPFRVRSAVLIKSGVKSWLRDLSGTELAIDILTKLTLRASPLDIANDILVLDGASESFIRALRIHFTHSYKQENRERPFKKIISSGSKYDDGLQLADMIAGAIREYLWEEDATYYKTFFSKIIDLWEVK
jgi:hypothetical protein